MRVRALCVFAVASLLSVRVCVSGLTSSWYLSSLCAKLKVPSSGISFPGLHRAPVVRVCACVRARARVLVCVLDRPFCPFAHMRINLPDHDASAKTQGRS